jgi:hypothetical protein
MPLQNRVAPNGDIFATSAKGTMLGNRGGKIHRDDKTLGKKRWASTHWICCELHWKDAHHEPMGPGYTSLFFLDEVTALSAGHRPCFSCRHSEAKAFLGDQKVGPFDLELHQQRLAGAHDGVPSQGSMIEIEGAAYALRGKRLLRWTPEGYDAATDLPAHSQFKVLTPPLITAILAKGYQPRWHTSAQQWDTT